MTRNQSHTPDSAPALQPRRARATDPDTSHQAAAALTTERLRQSQAEVLALLREHGPMCDSVIAMQARRAGIRQSPSGLRTRRAELVALGSVGDSGKRVKLSTGRKSIIWTALTAAADLVQENHNATTDA